MRFIPYLYFAGDAEEAMAFYAEALGGATSPIMRYDPEAAKSWPTMAGKVLHGEVKAGGIDLYFSDQPEGVVEGNRVHLTLDLDSEEELRRVYRAFSQGAKGKGMEPQDTFWGAVYGTVTDRYGVMWDLNFQKQPRPS